jgi:hypothetical protein
MTLRNILNSLLTMSLTLENTNIIPGFPSEYLEVNYILLLERERERERERTSPYLLFYFTLLIYPVST